MANGGFLPRLHSHAQVSNDLGGSVVDRMQTLLDADKEKTMSELDDSISPLIDPFYAKAQVEAEDDALIGIQRSQEWITKRTKEIANEELKKKDDDSSRIGKDYFKIERIDNVMEIGKCHILPFEAQGKYNNWMQKHDLEVTTEFARTHTPEETFRKKLEADNEISLNIEKKKLQEESRKSNLATLMMIKSSLFCLLIPVLGMLPNPYNSFCVLPVFYVVYLNYPAMKKLRQMMKEINEENVKIKKDDNYDPAV